MESPGFWADRIFSETLRLCLGEEASKPTEFDLTEEGQRQIKVFKEVMKGIVEEIQKDSSNN